MFRNEEIGCLTCDFDLVYQILHMYTHLFSTKNNFKQFIDYYYLLVYSKDKYEKNLIILVLNSLGVLKYAEGIMWIMEVVLGLSKKYLLCDSNPEVGKLILNHSLMYGKFSDNKLIAYIEQVICNIGMISAFPQDVLLRPFFLIWYKFWWKIAMRMKIRMIYG